MRGPLAAGARLSKLESAISKQRTIQFRYWSPARDRETERRLNPYALRLDEGVWYVIGHDLDRDAIRTFRVARIRSDIRFATRRERDFRLKFKESLESALLVYPQAELKVEGRGLVLQPSAPPGPPRSVVYLQRQRRLERQRILP